jgi:hypothetical protein
MSYPLLKRLFNTAALRLQSCCRACIQRQEFKLNRSVDVFVSNFFPRILMRYVSRGLERFGYCACLFALIKSVTQHVKKTLTRQPLGG